MAFPFLQSDHWHLYLQLILPLGRSGATSLYPTLSPQAINILAAIKIIGGSYAFLYINYYLCKNSCSVGCQTNHIHHYHSNG